MASAFSSALARLKSPRPISSPTFRKLFIGARQVFRAASSGGGVARTEPATNIESAAAANAVPLIERVFERITTVNHKGTANGNKNEKQTRKRYDRRALMPLKCGFARQAVWINTHGCIGIIFRTVSQPSLLLAQRYHAIVSE